jgi:chromosome segregation ATPase
LPLPSLLSLSFAQTIDDVTNRAVLQKKIAECEKDAPSLKGKLSEAEKERERASAAYRAAANKYADFLDTLEEQWKTCQSERERLERAGIQLGSSCLNNAACYAEISKFWASCMPVYDQKFDAADPLPEAEKRLHGN